ncbi:MAG: SWIB/MDM2 domain-containing protein [Bacteroidota bacterium]|nr:SWIB/MDM2 domain-containing protein [Bacteroidota bacterium]
MAKKATESKSAAPEKAKAAKADAPKKEAKATKADVTKPRSTNSGLMKPVNVSKELAEIVGGDKMSRPEVTKKLWEYIKSHKLQDEKEKRTIHADDKLLKVFDGKKSVNMFEMTKLVSAHLKADK